MEKHEEGHLHSHISYLFPSYCGLIHSFIFVFSLIRRRIGESPERIPLPPPFASYSTVSRAEPSRANSYRSVPSHPREEPAVNSTITASVTSPSAAESRVLEPQVQ
jgi:hypothetical protein